MQVVPFTAWDAEVAGALRWDRLVRALSPGGRRPSLGLRSDPAEVLTADRAGPPVAVRSIR